MELAEGAVDRLRKVVDLGEAHPELIQMDIYVDRTRCGTVGCLAGWLVILEHGEKAVNFDSDTVNVEGKVELIDTEACRLLGINPSSPLISQLFYSNWGISGREVRHHVENTLGVTL